MKKFLPIAIMFLLLPLYADWNDHHLTLLSTGSSSIEGASKYELKDGNGRVFFINSVGEPERPVMKRILKHKDDFFSWKNITIKELSFYLYEKGIQASIVPSSITYKGADLKQYLPSGFTFIEEKDGLNYRYRVIVGNTSLKLDGSYKGEEPLLDEMNAYIKGIRDGKIVVEDERVVSGSVVSFTDEKDKGEKQVHPIGDLTDLGKETGIRLFASDKVATMVTAEVGAIWPLFHFGEMVNPGVGVNLSLKKSGLFYEGVEAGIEVGFYYMFGKDSMAEENQNSDYGLFVPFSLYGGYRFDLPQNFSVIPFVSAGMAYFNMKYTSRDKASFAIRERTLEDTDPALNAGFWVQYRLTDTMYVNVRCSFGYLIGSDMGMYIISDAGVVYRL